VARQTSQKRQQPSEEKSWGEPISRRSAFPNSQTPSKDLTIGGGGRGCWPPQQANSCRDGAQAFLRNKAIFQGAFTWSSRPADRPKAGLRTRGLRRLNGAQAFLPNKAIFRTKSGDTEKSAKAWGRRGYIFMCRDISAERCTGVSAKQSHFPRGVHAVLTPGRPPEGGTPNRGPQTAGRCTGISAKQSHSLAMR
jgi:hypothetical protein